MSAANPSPNSYRAAPKSVSGLFEIVAIMCQLSQGNIAPAEALRRMTGLLGTEATAICRVDLRSARDATTVISHEARRYHSEDVGRLDMSFARGICKDNIGTAITGSVWSGTAEDFGDRDPLALVFRHRRLAETVVIPLARQGSSGDFLELHFGDPVSAGLLSHLEFLGPVLADCWKARTLGLFSDMLLSRRRVRSHPTARAAILAMENPCRLSRAEYRVCLLLSRGLNNQSVLSALSITMATLRTHLRNIYAKTGTASQPELIHLLLNPAPRRGTRDEDDADVA
ncbi:LuxR C-terminal-related transcriptional regulator [Sedimentitalea sp. JM2-8]|uniref:LuxR C-terminal-related transcriptional regulator n=1 Tax=Sedimentitalea xiamensis TaxID=3050037 RepID=A0ABT7FBU6_9RHOB|nr:LuxR family transcriptional regulator [Sedimentitalea xiamensis]MDK3072574.1 LuxR C-terminal-related transcriptional regulator [Sedimentitalea xiamensis]